MTLNKKLISLGFLLSLVSIHSSCNTPKSRVGEGSGDPSSEQSAQMSNSSVSIEYVLGRDRYKFVARAENTKVMASTFLDKQLLKRGAIDEQRYPGFFTKASEIVQNLNRAPAADAFCRSPFILTVRTGSETKTARGCRSSDDGALSKLVKEGEFLLYSKK
jgi:hypothetical protein